MTKEELLAAFDVKLPNADIETELQVEDQTPAAHVERSPTALKLDDWSMRRGREVLESSDRLKGMFSGRPSQAQIDAFQRGETPPGQRELVEDAGEWKFVGEDGKPLPPLDVKQTERELAVADFHAAAFEPEPELADACKNERIHQYMKNLMETPEFKALHAETQLDETASEIAAAAFAEQWVAMVRTAQPSDQFKSDMQCLGAAAKALESASTEVSDMRDAQNALGMGGHGATGGSISAVALSGMFKRVQGSQQLRRICELAGRYRRFAQAQQRKKVLHGRDDVVGVVLDGDVGRMLPHELAQLDDPDLELDVMRRLVERQAMCREYRGVESKARGPIVIVVDESGSMGGEKIYTAKAIALALAWVARHQRRYCALVGFSGGTEGNFLVIPPGKPDPDALMVWLEHFFSGGTTLDVPLDVLPRSWESMGCPKGKTDIICITDAIVSCPDDLRESFLAFKAREQVKMVSLVLEGEPGDLAAVSDRVHCVKSLSLEEAAVQEALTV